MIEKQNNILAHTSWGAIAAGAVLALAVQFMLGLLGVGIGFVSADVQDGLNMSAIGWGAGIWMALTFFISLFIGGYVASRLSHNVFKFAGSLNSLVVWALVVGLNLMIAGSGVSKVTGMFSNTISSAAKSINIDAPTQMISGINFQEMEEEIDQILRESDNEELKSLVQREYDDIKSSARSAASDVLRNPGNMSQIVQEFGDDAQRSLQQINQEVSREDLAEVVAAKSDMSEQEAQQAVTEWKNKIEDWSQNFQAKMNEAQDQVLMQAQEATESTGRAALYGFLALLLGMIAAFIGGRLGSSRSREELHVRS